MCPFTLNKSLSISSQSEISYHFQHADCPYTPCVKNNRREIEYNFFTQQSCIKQCRNNTVQITGPRCNTNRTISLCGIIHVHHAQRFSVKLICRFVQYASVKMVMIFFWMFTKKNDAIIDLRWLNASVLAVLAPFTWM